MKRAHRIAILAFLAALLGGFLTAAPASAQPRYDSWQSPAGAVKCRMYMNGSMGRYTLACLVLRSNTLVKWGGNFPDCSVGIVGPCGRGLSVRKATASQRAQFSGARRVSYGPVFAMGERRYGFYVVECQVLASTGSTCGYGPDDPVWINFRSGVVRICASSAYNGSTVCRRVAG